MTTQTTFFDRLADKIAARIVNAMMPRIWKVCEQQQYTATVFRDQLFLSKGSDIFIRPVDEVIKWKNQ